MIESELAKGKLSSIYFNSLILIGEIKVSKLIDEADLVLSP